MISDKNINYHIYIYIYIYIYIITIGINDQVIDMTEYSIDYVVEQSMDDIVEFNCQETND